jgi:hypothetical protein
VSNRHVPQINEYGAIGLPCCYEKAGPLQSRTPPGPSRSSIDLSGSKEKLKVVKHGSVRDVSLAASPSRLTRNTIPNDPSKKFGTETKECAKPKSSKAVTTGKKNLTTHTSDYESSNREKINSSSSKFSHVKSRLMDGPPERFKPEPITNKKPKARSNKKISKAPDLPEGNSSKKDNNSTTQAFIEHQSNKNQNQQPRKVTPGKKISGKAKSPARTPVQGSPDTLENYKCANLYRSNGLVSGNSQAQTRKMTSTEVHRTFETHDPIFATTQESS